MALHEHFVHARDCTEVTINLERRMGIEQVVVSLARREKHANHSVSMVAIVHTGPEVNLPSERPAGSIVTALLQCDACTLDQVRSFFRGNLSAREKAIQVRNVAVFIVGIVPVLEPFRNLSILTGLCRREALDSCFHLGTHIFINAKDLGSFNRVVQNIADNLVVHRRAKANVVTAVVVFRRITRSGHQVLVARGRFFDEAVHEEECGTLHGRINILEVFLIGRIVEEVFPKVRTKPARAGRPKAPSAINRSRTVPKVGIVVFDPTFVNTPVNLGGLFALRDHGLDFVNERPHTFFEVAGFCRPVVHFEVDVGGVLTAPNRVRVLIPDALQVGRLATLAGACNEQVTTILIMEFYERRVVRRIKILDASRGDIACALVGRAEVELNAVENGLVIFQVVLQDVFIGLLCNLRHDFGSDCTRITAYIVIRLEVCCGREDKRCAVGTFDIDVAIGDTDLAAVRNHCQAILELDGVDRDIVNERIATGGHAVIAMRSRHCCVKAHGAAFVSRQMNDNHMVWIACEIFTRMVHAAMRVRSLCDSRLQIEFTAVIRGPLVRSRNNQVAHRLETCRARANHVIGHDGFRCAIVATP